MGTGYNYFTDEKGEHFAVDNNTGETVKAREILIVEGSQIRTPQQQQAYNMRKEMEEKRWLSRERGKTLGNFFFAEAEKPYQLSPESMARLMYLVTYLSYADSRLHLSERTPMAKRDALKILQVSPKTAYNFWGDVSGKYIFEHEDGGLYVNNLFQRGALGKHIGSQYQKIYIESLRKLYQLTKSSSHRYLGYAFCMLPFINIEYNMLCWNPLERDLNKIEPIFLNDFCGKINYDIGHKRRLCHTYSKLVFTINGVSQRFCSFIYDGTSMGQERIFVNPRILYSGSDWRSVEVLGKFCET